LSIASLADLEKTVHTSGDKKAGGISLEIESLNEPGEPPAYFASRYPR